MVGLSAIPNVVQGISTTQFARSITTRELEEMTLEKANATTEIIQNDCCLWGAPIRAWPLDLIPSASEMSVPVLR